MGPLYRCIHDVVLFVNGLRWVVIELKRPGVPARQALVLFAQKILRTVPGNWTFVVVTDRVELDDQIAKTFAACGAVDDATACHSSSGTHLRQLVRENHRYVFTLIHKFQTAEVLNDRRDVIVIADEAHGRSTTSSP